MSRKMIVLDDPTVRFLGELRNFRRRLGKSQSELVKALKLKKGTYQMYELGLNYPSLETLMRLADYFGCDLSESVNHKVFYGTLQPRDIKRELKRYDLSYREISEQTGYALDRISYSVHMRAKGSLSCLSAVLEVLRRERESESFREELCRDGKRKSPRVGKCDLFLEQEGKR